MNKKKLQFFFLVALSISILIAAGSTFAYFTATISSETNAVNVTAATFKLEYEDDLSLIKQNIIPSEERYVDISLNRLDENGNFLKPYEDTNTGDTITAGTTCIDDNLREICSVYTFTVKNTMTDTDIPLYITLDTNYNTFENLYFKVLDEEKNEVISATHLVDDRPYTLNGDEKVYDSESKITPVVLTEINKILAKATNSETPSTVTYSIVLWIMENNRNQTKTDSGKLFAGTINVKGSGLDGNGITGVFGSLGNE